MFVMWLSDGYCICDILNINFTSTEILTAFVEGTSLELKYQNGEIVH